MSSTQVRGALLPATTRALRGAGLDPDNVAAVVRRGLVEDLGERGDVTTAATVDPARQLGCHVVSRQPGVVAGLPVLAAICDLAVNAGTHPRTMTAALADGDLVAGGQLVAGLRGPARDLLAIERLSLNLLGRLSGVATVTRQWVEAIEGSGANIRDTRKTTPGLRDLEKYAVRCGGGVNHRRGLDDGILIKDNHLSAAGGVTAALERLSAVLDSPGHHCRLMQLEVDDLDQLDEALAHRIFTAAPDDGSVQLLFDNFELADLADGVRRVRGAAPNVLTEASGGLTLLAAADVAATGVDFLAVGAITHSAPVLDLGFDAVA